MIHELSSVKTEDGIIWLIHGKHNESFVCRPKYFLENGRNVRLYSPIFNMKDSAVFSKYRRYDRSSVYQGLYLLGKDDVMSGEQRDYHDEISVASKTGKVAQKVFNELLQNGITDTRIGFLGSLIWKNEIDGISDINFVIMGDEPFQQYLGVCESVAGLSFRTKDEWRSFYHEYHVVGIEEEVFVEKSCMNHQQGFAYGIPFTVFHIRDELPAFESMNKKAEHVHFVGEYVSDQSSCGYFPLIGKILHENSSPYRIMIWNRFYSTFFPIHAILEVDGMKNGNQIIVSPTDSIKVLKEL